MDDIPKPLPRTKIRKKPIQLVNEASHDSSLFQETNDGKEKEIFTSELGNSISNGHSGEQSSHANAIIEIEPDNKLSHTNGDQTSRDYDAQSNYVCDQSMDAETPDAREGEPLKEENEDRHSDIFDKEYDDDDNDNGDDDDDEVVNEILRFKRENVEKTQRENERTVGTVSEQFSEKSIPSKFGSVEGDNEDLLGIQIHRTDCLKMDRIIRHPSVIVHIVDVENKGVYLRKSKPDKNVTYNQERSSFILPVMTRPFNFKENRCIIPEWEEILTFNESTSYIVRPSTIFFFEVVDFIDSSNSDADYASIGWHRVAWAFLKPIGNNVQNTEKLLRLQLYASDPKSTSINNNDVPDVYNWYRKKHWKLYPSTIYITIKNVSSSKIDDKPQQRSCTPFQPEIGSDTSVKSLALLSNSDDSADTKSSANMSAICRLGNIDWSRLPGQSCRIPNTKIATLHPDSKGSLAVKFSNSGIFLACGTCSDVFIYAVDGVLERRLTNHQGLIYTLCWYTDDNLLLSASADCTACIWDMKSSNESPLQILPHPSFVYCSTFIYPEQTIVTGCYDGIVRIWWYMHASSKNWQLHQELTGHEEYISALTSFKNKEFFSGDASGLIIHWNADENGRWFQLNAIKLSEIQGTIINRLVVFPGHKRLLIHTRDSLLRTMGIKTFVIIQWYQGGLNDTSQCNSIITPCGSLIFSSSEDGTVNIWESNTGKHLGFYSSGNVVPGCGGTIDFHPFDHICAFSFYSTGSPSSSVNLLKYSANMIGKTDVMLYMLNGSTNSLYEQYYNRVSLSNKQLDTDNSGKYSLKKNKLKSSTINSKTKIKK